MRGAMSTFKVRPRQSCALCSGFERSVTFLNAIVIADQVCTFYGFIVEENAEILPVDQPEPQPVRKMEFIGDSDTCGFGNEGKASSAKNLFGMKGRMENVYNGYACIAARMFDAEEHVLAWSGYVQFVVVALFLVVIVCSFFILRSKGVHSNSADWGPNMPALWKNTLASRPGDWDMSSWIPDVVVINLGINDLSPPASAETDIITGYASFLLEVRSYRPDANIFCVVYDDGCISSEDSETNRKFVSLQLQEIIKVAISKVSKHDDKMHYTFIKIEEGLEKDDYASMMHYAVSGHVKIAKVLTEEIALRTGWSVEHEPETMPYPQPKDQILTPRDHSKTSCTVSNFAKALKETEIELVALHETENLVDLIWKGRPAVSPSKVAFLSEAYTGRSVADKLKSLREAVKEKGADAVVLTALDDIAWLFNIRGNDVEFNPVVTSYAIVTSDSATLFLDAANPDEVNQHLGPSGVACKPYASMLNEVSAFVSANKDQKILVDPAQCNVAVFLAIPAANRKEDTSVVMAQKAIKSSVEIEGMRQAHLRDGAALVRYFSWLEKEMDAGHEDQWDEVLVADKQEEFRQQVKDYVSLSFDTISSVGANGSIIHYSPKRGDCAKMSTSAMYLNDSGAQYLDGTTDVTRTLHFGQPTEYEKACFTYVLKGHIALASTVFPDKTEGVRLDAITRAPLWKAGLDYRHGTGHGVGAFLNVHEKGVIQDGMVLSNEPGYYEDGKFGIRIESVMVAKKAPHIKSPLNREFCEFETLTMAPIQQKLIDDSLLTAEEIKWLNAYHKEVRDKLQPLLKEDHETYAYLVRETKPLPLPQA
ncbi:unnamed protein product [Phytophthora fragariaefolia]|uniref:Unnamed protein product n=1 Tax=Phytophthora fragariaefolia TaxID=1490495 RepID=A0A9W6XQ33_9STRA|nr:unnamed protein product [Phytophthora fragariaefolia]